MYREYTTRSLYDTEESNQQKTTCNTDIANKIDESSV